MVNYLKGVLETLRLKYSFPKLQWIIGTISITSLLYLSSEEIWKTVDAKPFPEVSIEGFICYLVFFLPILAVVHYIDTKRVVQRNSVAVGASLVSIVVDISLISLAESAVLYALQVLPQDYLKAIIMLLIGALPSSVGAIVLSSLTGDVLKKRAERLHEEVQGIINQVEKLQNRIKKSRERLKNFEKKKNEFEEYFKRQKRERGRPNGK